MRPGHIAQAAFVRYSKTYEKTHGWLAASAMASPVAKIQKHKGELYVHSLS